MRFSLRRRLGGIPAVLMALVITGACGDGPAEPNEPEIHFEIVGSGLAQPSHVAAPQGDDRLFVTERSGSVRILREGTIEDEAFLDLSDRVSTDGNERGLLSIAFDPDFAANGYFYVFYTAIPDGDVVVERYTVSTADPDLADPGSAREVLRVEHAAPFHNGGALAFGPDGFLYISIGDGGMGDGAGDPGTLLGKILRIDVRGDPYAIPADNPFVGEAGARGEVWARGLRNPWRFSIDPVADLIFIADVGQDAWEEINVEPLGVGGLHYGWNVMEGSHCYPDDGECDTTGLTFPVHEYGHEEVGGCAVTGGAVYRGSGNPGLVGHYFYTDSCKVDWLQSFRIEDGQAVEHTDWPVSGLSAAVSFGTGGDGELYIVSMAGNGRDILRIVER